MIPVGKGFLGLGCGGPERGEYLTTKEECPRRHEAGTFFLGSFGITPDIPTVPTAYGRRPSDGEPIHASYLVTRASQSPLPGSPWLYGGPLFWDCGSLLVVRCSLLARYLLLGRAFRSDLHDIR